MPLKLPYLPQNMMEEIFHKLPYDALTRSKLLSKHWNSTISSSKFMDYHYNYRQSIEGYHLIVLDNNDEKDLGYTYESKLYTSSYIDLVTGRQPSLTSMTIPTYTHDEDYYTRPRIVGSYNGLVALACYDNLILWNPLTTKYSSVNCTVHGPDFGHDTGRILYGLCYDVSRDKYSVVVGSDYQSPPASPLTFDNDRAYEVHCCYLYDFKDGFVKDLCRDGSWSDRRLLDYKSFEGQSGKVVRGFPHWVVQFYDFIDPVVKTEILYFDFNDEKLKQMESHPTTGHGSVDKELLGLATLDDENQLGCVLRDRVGSYLEVWVMKEYGNSETWTNMFTIPYLNLTNTDLGSITDLVVIGFMSSGKLLLYMNVIELWIYDLSKGDCREIKVDDIEFDFVIPYSPTLISPPDEQKKLSRHRTHSRKRRHHR